MLQSNEPLEMHRPLGPGSVPQFLIYQVGFPLPIPIISYRPGTPF